MTKSLLRKDMRKTNTQLREMEAELGVLEKADGSAKFSQGNTSVICSVIGPESAMKERGDKAIIDVVFQPRDKRASEEEKEYELIIRESLESIILTTLYPRTIITVSIQVLLNDGCLLSTSFNAAILALLDAGVAMKTTLVSASCSYLTSDDCLLDPIRIEQDFSTVLHSSDSSSFVEFYKSSNNTNVIQPKGFACFVFDSALLKNDKTDENSLVSCVSDGIFTDSAFETSLEMAKEGAKSVSKLIRMTLEKKSTTPVLPTKVPKGQFIKPKE